MSWTLTDFVRESNRIEGIQRDPTEAEIVATEYLVKLPEIRLRHLEDLVSVYAPHAKLRRHRGMDVQVGGHIPPRGGPQIERDLIDLLDLINDGFDPHESHIRYETLHPFMDGNGRSGRAIWLWQHKGLAPIGFLHQFYYDTLRADR